MLLHSLQPFLEVVLLMISMSLVHGVTPLGLCSPWGREENQHCATESVHARPCGLVGYTNYLHCDLFVYHLICTVKGTELILESVYRYCSRWTCRLVESGLKPDYFLLWGSESLPFHYFISSKRIDFLLFLKKQLPIWKPCKMPDLCRSLVLPKFNQNYWQLSAALRT